MRYGKVTETIWTDDKFMGLTDTSKLLFIYLLSCSKCNSVGIFQIGLGAIEDDFGHSRQEIKAGLEELGRSSLVQYEGNWVSFNKFLKWNAPVSPNHARQIASVLNECIMQDAPSGAVCNFLGSVYGILNAMKYKTQSGQTKTYWEEFRTTLDVDMVTAYVGGHEAFMNCIKGVSCNSGSTGKALPEDSFSTFRKSLQDKHSGSTSEVLPKDLATQTRNRQETETYKTRNRTDTNCSGSCDDKSSEMSVICSDGQPHAVSEASVRMVAGRNPEWDMHLLKIRLQVMTAMDESVRPDPDRLDDFFLEVSSTFDGDTVRKPEKRFSQEKHESSPPTGKGALDGPCERSGEGSDAEEEDA